MPRPTMTRTRAIRRFAAFTVTASVAAACATPLSVESSVASKGELVASIPSPLKGERFDIAGNIGTTGPRNVVLEERKDDAWVRVPGRRARTSTTGAFGFEGLSIDRITRFRAQAAPTSVSGDHRAATSTAVLALKPLARGQRARLRTLPEIAGSPDDRPRSMSSANGMVEAVFVPARPGRPVQFAGRSDGGKWRVIGRTEQDASGMASVEFADASAASEWRARTASVDGVKPFEVIDKPSRWKPRLASAFNEKDELPDEWTHRQLRTWLPSRTCMLNTERGVDLDGSVARITTARMDSLPRDVSGTRPRKTVQDKQCVDATNERHVYGTGMISTADSLRFVHGIAAARVRFDEHAGQHGAFWLQTNEPNDTEIDVVESFGRRTQPLSVTLHQTNDNENTAFRYKPLLSELGSKTTDWFDDFHIYSVEWTKGEYVFRIDGREVFRVEKALSNAPHYVVLSNIVADYEIARNDGSGSKMEVDWVRVWQ